jgi:hypothetical protein
MHHSLHARMEPRGAASDNASGARRKAISEQALQLQVTTSQKLDSDQNDPQLVTRIRWERQAFVPLWVQVKS